jgi:hypothetical protein
VKARTALELGRVSNLPTVWTNVIAGALLGSGEARPSALTTCGVAAACSLFYVGGMWLNDAFDREFDARVRPGRPIPSGRATALEVFVGGFGMLAAGLVVLAVVAPAAPSAATLLLVGVGLAAAVVLYDVHHKQNRLAPVLMGLCRVGVYLTAAAAVAPLGATVLYGAAVLLAYLIGLTYVARQENLAEVKNLWPLLFLGAPFFYAPPTGLLTGVLTLGLLVWVANAISLIRARPPQVRAAVVGLIAGISLVDAMLIAHQGGAWLCLVAVAGFALTLVAQRWIEGT